MLRLILFSFSLAILQLHSVISLFYFPFWLLGDHFFVSSILWPIQSLVCYISAFIDPTPRLSTILQFSISYPLWIVEGTTRELLLYNLFNTPCPITTTKGDARRCHGFRQCINKRGHKKLMLVGQFLGAFWDVRKSHSIFITWYSIILGH